MSLTIDYGTDVALVAGEKGAGGTKYSLKLINESTQPWIFFVFQKLPEETPKIFSLAWFASPYLLVPGTDITFEWQINYNFVWTQTGVLIPGVVFHASATKDCDPAGANTTNFSLNPGPNLSNPYKAPPAGSLVINDAADVPGEQFAVGIGMSGMGTFAVQAGPNLKHMFTPKPTYWVAAGADQKIGTVLDIATITKTAEAKFPTNVYALKATLGEDNLWKVG